MDKSTEQHSGTLHLVVAITCHNRREKTTACLRRLSQIGLDLEDAEAVDLDVVLVDDNSSDGTAAAVRNEFPDVALLEGDGSLFWNGGMRIAMSHAIDMDPEYILLLNDDTELFEDSVKRLIEDHRRIKERRGCPIVIVGSTRDPDSGELTYGGWRRTGGINPLRTAIVHPTEEPKICDTFNANCALISREVLDRVGNLDAAYTHGFGDYDYGFRVQKQGGEVWVGSGVHGECERDHGPRPWFEPKLSWWERISALRDVKAEPLGERLTYARRHAGARWPLSWLSPYIRVSLSHIFPDRFRPPAGPGERSSESSTP
ncbi:glycosyltransferase [Longibacter salinarum]|uniref:Glycosyltransferase n=1 Tax=Longibacter salinarum TaxID=1850348 RepID=A0A2A8D0V9_9BACT|nr:glycosyltransferase family 2 protein [Longibacter salinarum]PEN14521.1 glycosyltransferase [Longibacter salinarum]